MTTLITYDERVNTAIQSWILECDYLNELKEILGFQPWQLQLEPWKSINTWYSLHNYSMCLEQHFVEVHDTSDNCECSSNTCWLYHVHCKGDLDRLKRLLVVHLKQHIRSTT